MCNVRRNWRYSLAIFWAAQMAVCTVAVAVVAAQTRSTIDTAAVVDAAVVKERMENLTKQVAQLQSLQMESRLRVLESDNVDAKSERTELKRLAYGIIGGVMVQLLLTAAQLRRKPDS